MADDIYGNMSNMNIDELGSSLLQKKEASDKAAAKKAKKNEKVQQGLALLLMGQGVMKGQLKKRMAEAKNFHTFKIQDTENRAQEMAVHSNIASKIGTTWKDEGGSLEDRLDSFESSDDYDAFSQEVAQYVDAKIKAYAPAEYPDMVNKSVYANSMRLGTRDFARHYLKTDEKGVSNYQKQETLLRDIFDSEERDMDREELFNLGAGIGKATLSSYERKNYQNVLADYKSQGNLLGGFRKVAGIFNKKYRSQGGLDIFSSMTEEDLAGPLMTDLSQALNLKGMIGSLGNAIAEARKSPTIWRELAETKTQAVFVSKIANFEQGPLSEMASMIEEGTYPSELKGTVTNINKSNIEEALEHLSLEENDGQKQNFIIDVAALSLRLKKDENFLNAVYKKTEGLRGQNKKSYGEFKDILSDENSRVQFAAMIAIDYGYKEATRRFSATGKREAKYNTYGTLIGIYDSMALEPVIGKGIKVNNSGKVEYSANYKKMTNVQKKEALQMEVTRIGEDITYSPQKKRIFINALESDINTVFQKDLKDFEQDFIDNRKKEVETPVSLEQEIQQKISELPERTPFAEFIGGNARERKIKMDETSKFNKTKRKELIAKENNLIKEITNINKEKTLPISRNLFTLPSEKEDKEIKDENARYVTDLITEKYNINTNTNNLQKISFQIKNTLKNNPEAYDEIIDIIKNKNNREYLESLKDEKKKLSSNYENPEYNKLLNIHLDRLGIDDKEKATQDLNELASFILEAESDGNFNAVNLNKKGELTETSARGGYQFKPLSVDPAVVRLERRLGRLPRFDEVRKTGDVRSLSPEDQTLLFMADILEKTAYINKEPRPGYGDKLFNDFLNADNKKDKQKAAYEIYEILHHTQIDGTIPRIAKFQTKRKLKKYFNE